MSPTTKKLSIVLLILVVVAVCMWCFTSDDQVPRHVWLYDTNTKTLFVGDVTALPPVEGPSSGPTGSSPGASIGVLARVIRRHGQHESVVVLLTKYTPEAKKLIEEVRINASTAMAHRVAIEEGTLVASPPGAEKSDIVWAPIGSKKGMEIIASMQAIIGDGPYDIILP